MTSLTAESATGNSRAGAGAHARSAAADASALSTADIIVVDDSRTVVKLLEMGLRNAGLSVGVASEAARDSRCAGAVPRPDARRHVMPSSTASS